MFLFSPPSLLMLLSLPVLSLSQWVERTHSGKCSSTFQVLLMISLFEEMGNDLTVLYVGFRGGFLLGMLSWSDGILKKQSCLARVAGTLSHSMGS